MTWVRVDDRLPFHPKFLRLGADRRACLAVWMEAMCYAGSYLTDGYIPDGALPDIEYEAARLVEVGLWERTEDGWRIHDYLDYQTSREYVEDLREKRAAAGRRGGQRSGEVRREAAASAPVEATDEALASPRLEPRIQNPTQPSLSNESESRARAEKPNLDEVWAHVSALRNGNATEQQVDTIRGLIEQIGDREKVFAVLRTWAGAPLADRYGPALKELIAVASEVRRRPRLQAVRSGTNYDDLAITDDDEQASDVHSTGPPTAIAGGTH